MTGQPTLPRGVTTATVAAGTATLTPSPSNMLFRGTSYDTLAGVGIKTRNRSISRSVQRLFNLTDGKHINYAVSGSRIGWAQTTDTTTANASWANLWWNWNAGGTVAPRPAKWGIDISGHDTNDAAIATTSLTEYGEAMTACIGYVRAGGYWPYSDLSVAHRGTHTTGTVCAGVPVAYQTTSTTGDSWIITTPTDMGENEPGAWVTLFFTTGWTGRNATWKLDSGSTTAFTTGGRFGAGSSTFVGVTSIRVWIANTYNNGGSSLSTGVADTHTLTVTAGTAINAGSLNFLGWAMESPQPVWCVVPSMVQPSNGSGPWAALADGLIHDQFNDLKLKTIIPFFTTATSATTTGVTSTGVQDPSVFYADTDTGMGGKSYVAAATPFSGTGIMKTYAEWRASSVILGNGKLGLCSDTGMCKIGDGVNTWANLALPTTSAMTTAIAAGGTGVAVGWTAFSNRRYFGPADNLHPNEQGAARWANGILAGTRQALTAGALPHWTLGYSELETRDMLTTDGGVSVVSGSPPVVIEPWAGAAGAVLPASTWTTQPVGTWRQDGLGHAYVWCSKWAGMTVSEDFNHAISASSLNSPVLSTLAGTLGTILDSSSVPAGYMVTNSGAFALATTDITTVATQQAMVRLMTVSTGTGNGGGLLLRCVDASNYVAVYENTAGTYTIGTRTTAGGLIARATCSDLGQAAGQLLFASIDAANVVRVWAGTPGGTWVKSATTYTVVDAALLNSGTGSKVGVCCGGNNSMVGVPMWEQFYAGPVANGALSSLATNDMALTNIGVTDGTYGMLYQTVGTGPVNGDGFVFAATDELNYYRLKCNVTQQYWQVDKVVAGTATNVIAVASAPFENRFVYVTLAAGVITLYLNDAVSSTYTDGSPLSGTKIGPCATAVTLVNPSLRAGNVYAGVSNPTRNPGMTVIDTGTVGSVGWYDSRSILTTGAFASQGTFVSSKVTTNPQAGTTYTLALADAGKVVEATNAGAITVTVPTNASVAFPIGTKLDVWQGGAGQVTIAGAGVTFKAPGGLLHTRVQNSTVTLRKQATDTWVVSGDVA